MSAVHRNRIAYLDLARGLGMLAVIWGHIQVKGWTNTLVYAFDIPLFFFLSGMMYRKDKNPTVGSLLKRLFHKLIIPYVIISVVTWIIWAVPQIYFASKAGEINYSVYLGPLYQTVLAQGSGGYLIHNVPLWFISCLVVVNIIYYFLSKLGNVQAFCLCVVCAFIGYWMLNNDINFDFTRLPWNIESAMSAMLFFGAGNICSDKWGADYLALTVKNNRNIARCLCTVSIVLYVIGALMNGHISLGSNMLGNSTIMMYVIGFISIFAVLTFCILNCEFHNYPIFSGIEWIGRYSFYFMAIHVVVLQNIYLVLSKVCQMAGTTMESIEFGNFEYGLIFIVVLIISCILVKLYNWFKSEKLEYFKVL